jgi:DNA-binding transcriptional ArsR family regulator
MSEAKGSGDQRHLREEYPSGWLVLTKNESIPYIIDALLDAPPHREFNQSELARKAGVSRQSVSRHIDLLAGVGIIEPVEGTNPTRYRFNPGNSVSEALIKLDGSMNKAGAQLGPADD